jgi:16S rRNA (guanine(527)-N(7))-methyltransferase RsmG
MSTVTTLTLSAHHRAQLEPLSALLMQWNRAHNLVSRKMTPTEVVNLLWEATAFARFLPDQAHVADLGSGAGIPALPLAVIRPDLRIEAVEPRAKRCTWLRFAANQLGSPIKITESRWDPTWKHFDYVVSRAVFPPAQFCEAVGKLADRSLQMTGDHEPTDQRRAYALWREGERVGLVLAGTGIEALTCE